MQEYLSHMGLLGAPLLLCSVIGMTLIVERLVFYMRLPNIDSCTSLAGLTKALQDNAKQPKMIRDELISYLLLQAKQPYDFGIRILRIIAVISPMLGLLGTVIGIIKAFRIISLHDGPVYPALIADGLWTAMMTTALGLIIALPCLFAAFMFARMGEKRIARYQDILNRKSLEIEGVKL